MPAPLSLVKPRAETPIVPLDRSLLAVVERAVDEVQAYELADGIWCLRLPVPYPLPKSVNAVLLDAADGKIPIDTGNLVGLGLPGLERGLELAGSGSARSRPCSAPTCIPTTPS
jgi:hypothetical protein